MQCKQYLQSVLKVILPFLTIGSLVIATYDIFLQVPGTDPKLFVVVGAYLFLLLTSVLIMLGRMASVRSALALIPKLVLSNATLPIPFVSFHFSSIALKV
jgi:hypothetical protein